MQMGDRIRHLEEALESLQRTSTSEPHALLRPELLLIKSSLELYGVAQTHHTTAPPGRGIFDSESTPRTDSTSDDRPFADDSHEQLSCESRHLNLPPSVLQMSQRFPVFPVIPSETEPGLRQRIREALPPRTHAQHLWEQTCHHALWQCVIFCTC